MKEPTFLRRLRQQHAGNGGPERYIAPRNKKAPTSDDEDAPTYVLDDRTNETISRKEFEAMARGDPKGEEGGDTAEAKVGETPGGEGQVAGKLNVKKRTKENLTDVGGEGGKKRKAVRIVGAGDDDDDGKDSSGTSGKKKGRLGSKAKRPVTLSFGDDEA